MRSTLRYFNRPEGDFYHPLIDSSENYAGLLQRSEDLGGTVSEQEFRRALGYANSAMDLLKRGQIPPYPQFYELLYTYATGVNPSLNTRVNQIFRDGTATTELAERLYNQFLKSQDANERNSSVSERMARRIEAVHDAIDTAMATANSYSGTLQAASSDLEHDALSEAAQRMMA